ncbi:hypothetical protein JNK13_06905 [bacterium]|nr:hypothetical protein [bacterium]
MTYLRFIAFMLVIVFFTQLLILYRIETGVSIRDAARSVVEKGKTIHSDF